MLETINLLVKFAQLQDIFVCDLMVIMNIY
jgi:hypothetical protein